MKGFVPTPEAIVDRMVAKLFAGKPPDHHSTILDPGCGPGAFISGIIKWCEQHDRTPPTIVGYESEPQRHAEAAARFRDYPFVSILREDFLAPRSGSFDYVIGNPPYVSITALSVTEKEEFRRNFSVARGRFDLYLLFFQQAMRLLGPRGRLVFITPEKFLYVNTAEPLRRLLGDYHVCEIELLNEETFADLLTYPTITTLEVPVVKHGLTNIVLRDGTRRCTALPQDGSSLQPLLHGELHTTRAPALVLEEIAVRISCGPASGVDSVFVQKTKSLDVSLRPYAFPTLSGRDLGTERGELRSDKSMLIPYDAVGRLLPLEDLGALRAYLSEPAVQSKLNSRTCVARKPWYAFHDSMPLPDILRPKLLCKDITAESYFWIDREGSIVPRHSVYYIVPRDPAQLEELQAYLNGPEATTWLRAHCQRAANGFLRLQSSVLKRLPIPVAFAPSAQHRDSLAPFQLQA